MSSSIKLKNSSGKIITIINPDTVTVDSTINVLDNAYTIATVNDFSTVPSGITTVIVKDKDRGGVFNRITLTTANGGTIFSGTGYSWERQYSGAVNVKWFGVDNTGNADIVGIINNIQSSLNSNGIIIEFDSGNYLVASQLKLNPGVILKGVKKPEYKNTAIGSWFNITYGINPTNPITESAIVLRIGSGIENFGIYYPNQVTSSSSNPTAYSWAISTNKLATGDSWNTDGIVCNSIMLLNAYRGIDLTNSAQFTIKEIFGQPIYEGIRLDQIYDVGTIERVHLWTFYASVGTNLYNWISTNGTAYKLGKADAISLKDLFCYGYNIGFHFTDLGNGPFWGSLDNSCCDISNYPLLINNCNILNVNNSTFTTTTRAKCSARIEGNISRYVSFSNCTFYGTSVAYGSLVKSNGGKIIFSNTYTNGTNTNDFRLGVVHDTTSTTKIEMNNCGTYYNHFLAPNDLFEGTIVPSKTNTSIVNANEFGLLSWTGGIPNGAWYETADDSNWIGQITNGGILKNPGNYVIPYSYEIDWETDYPLLGLSITLKSNNSNNTNIYAYLGTEVDTAIVSLLSFTDWCFEEDVNLYIPIIINKNMTYRYRFRIVKVSFGDANTTSTYEIKNLSFVQLDSSTTSSSFIDKINYSEAINCRKLGKNIEMVKYQAPNRNTWSIGDKVINSVPTVGQPKSWVCTTAGSPGTWVSEGNL